MSVAMAHSKRRSRRAHWFNSGVHAINCVLEGVPPDAYLCPLCLEYFTRADLDSGDLTDEHVPPEAVGGMPLVLTCESCNRTSGHRFDRSMSDEEKLRTFGKPYTLGPLPGSVTYNGIRNNGSIQFDGQTFVMLGDPGQNNPATLAAHTEALERLGDGEMLDLRFHVRSNPRRTAIGWLRSAYLAAFAVYGYRYVLQPSFSCLRAAIRDPEAATFDPVLLHAPCEGPLEPVILEVTSPAPIVGCRAVIFGPRLALLPPWGAGEDWFSTLRERLIGEPIDAIGVTSVIGARFPTNPMHVTDG